MPGLYRGGSAGRIINRTPTTGAGAGASMAYSRSVCVGGPQIEPLNSETGSDWTPYGTRISHPYRKRMPYSLMSVEQATGFLNSEPNPWPAAGQNDFPNGYQVVNQLKLQPTSSAHRGFMIPTGPNPNMVFIAPPVWGLQTRPLYATGVI